MITKNEIIAQIIKLTGIDASEVAEDAFFEEDLNVGEMEFIELLSELEDKYGVELITRKDEIDTIGELLEIILEKLE